MPLYPKPIQSRFPAAVTTLTQQVTKLQSRTAVVDSGFPVATLPAVIASNYPGSGKAMVYANGSATLTGPYACIGSYSARAGDNVLLQPVPAMQTYVIMGNTAEAGATTAWQTVTLATGFSGTVQYRFLDLSGLSVQLDGAVGLLATGEYNDTAWGAVAGAYSPAATRNWAAVPLSGTTYGNGTYPGAPHCFIQPGGALGLYGIPEGLNGTNVLVTGIYAI